MRRKSKTIREGFAGQRMIVLPRPVVQAELSGATSLDLLCTDIGYFPHAAHHAVKRPAGSPQMILILCVQGAGWAEIGTARYSIGAGQLLVMPQNVSHSYGADDANPWTIYWLHAAGRKIGRIHALLTDNDATPIFFCGEDPETLALFEETFSILRQSYGRDHLLLSSLALGRLLGRLIAVHRARPEFASTRQRIEQTVAFMRNRLSAKIHVSELARLANLSPSHFAWAFKRQTGYPVLDFFIRLKMQRAAQLLDTTPMPVKAIAAEMGFDDPLYFSRQFRKVHALSPAQYRAIKKG